jgi:hypothetical protein
MKLKEKLITVISSIPLIAATTMSGSCGAGCPYGIINCAYPGQCPRYTDVGGDGICDLSQSSLTGTNSNTETAASPSSSSSHDASAASSTTSSKSSSSTINPADGSSNGSEDTNASAVTDQGAGIDNGNIPSDHVNYFVFPVSILLIGAYLFTYYLFSKGILNQQKHRRIWNLLVTAGYLGTGVTGVLLILIVNLGVKSALNPSVTFWHAELAILMVVGTLIHVHLYWKPFKNMFRVLFGFKTPKKEKTDKSRSFSK